MKLGGMVRWGAGRTVRWEGAGRGMRLGAGCRMKWEGVCEMRLEVDPWRTRLGVDHRVRRGTGHRKM